MNVTSAAKLAVVFNLCVGLMAEAQSFKTITGTLLNKEDSAAVVGAHVFFDNTTLGTITNSDGVFSLTFDSLKFSDQYVRFSCLGYRSEMFLIDSLVKSAGTVVYLRPTVTFLKEVVVYSPETIINTFKKAIAKMPGFYVAQPVKMKAFYRELLMQDSSYVRLTDAALEIYQENYTSYDNDHRLVKVLESRISDDQTIDIKVKMPPSMLITKLRPLNFPQGFFEDHVFEMAITNIDSMEVYAITCTPKEEIQEAAFESIFYIKKDDHAFIGYDVRASEHHKNYFPQQQIKLKADGKKIKGLVKKTDERGSLRYFQYQGKSYVRSLQVNITYQVSSLDGSILTNVNTDSKLIIHHLETDDINFPKDSECIDYFKELTATKPYNQEFWTSFNILDYTAIENKIRNDLEKKKSLNEQFQKR